MTYMTLKTMIIVQGMYSHSCHQESVIVELDYTQRLVIGPYSDDPLRSLPIFTPSLSV
jgi:hypothetical protein